MFREIFGFELYYRFRRPATWIYFALLFLLAFGAISWDKITVGGGTGQVKDNAPTVIAFMMTILTAIPGFFISSAIMGVPVLRDYENKTEGMIFTTPIRKWQYLLGRFMGSLLVLILVFSGMLFGLMVGSVMPWLDADKFIAFNGWNFLQPFLIWVIPNAIISGILFFTGGTLSRNLLWVFVQGVLLLTFYLITSNLSSELENRTLSALIDPMGLNTIQVVAQYWTVSERNSQLIPLAGEVLGNRLIWLAFAGLMLTFTLVRFRFDVPARKSRKQKSVENAPMPVAAVIPQVTLSDGWATQFQRIMALTRLYFAEIVRSVPFIAIASMGILLLIVNAIDFETLYGTDTYPTTYQVLDLLSEFNLFFLILIVFYSGELVWRERDLQMNQIMDALPMPDYVGMVSKFLALMAVFVGILLLLMFTGIGIQASKGYFNFEIGVYLETLFTDTLFFLLMYSLFSFFVQAVANQKFLGHALVVLFFFITGVIFGQIGLEHRMFRFASADLGTFSDMNTYGHFTKPFAWFSLYWLGLGLVLFSLAIVGSVRGVDTLLKTRVRLAGMRFARPVLIFTSAALVLFIATGSYIYYNTNVVNKYRTSDSREKNQAQYEKTLKKYARIPQLRIVETNLKLDIMPAERDFAAKGFYVLKNKTDQPISDIHLQFNPATALTTEVLGFERVADGAKVGYSIKQKWPEFLYQIAHLDQPLAPGDSVRMNWTVVLDTKGFVESGSNTDVVFNGTFLNNTYFPSLGYSEEGELADDDDRKEQGLKPKERALNRDDEYGRHMNLVGDDADNLRFEIVMSTSPDQIAIAPGYLQKEWTEGNRRYFHYKMDAPMFNFFAMLSARYSVKKEAWVAPWGKTINLEIYYHPGHEYNLDRMMEAMKSSLSYYSAQFAPYQFRQMRILEFPRYATFAQSFANTVPFSEGIGFILNVKPDDVDMSYYVTAHEMAHQWWGHQVAEANVQGSAMISETMSQYSALMVMKQKYPPEMMQKFLKFELDRYLRGRASETKKEQPLVLVESQGYIHYRKGSLCMYALQDYIGEDHVNNALRNFNHEWAFREGIYPTTKDLMGYFRAETPDSLQYLLVDLFETITLYENQAKSVTTKELSGGKYEVDLEFSAVKYRADSLGNETEIPMKDWVDVGVFAKNQAGKDSLIYLQKHLIRTGKDQHLKVVVPSKPTKAGIDPINKLIDRTPEDNVKGV